MGVQNPSHKAILGWKDNLFVAARSQLDLGLLLWGIVVRPWAFSHGDTAWVNATISICGSQDPLQEENLGNMFKMQSPSSNPGPLNKNL